MRKGSAYFRKPFIARRSLSRLDTQALVPVCQSLSSGWHGWKDQQRVNADHSTGGVAAATVAVSHIETNAE